MNGNHNVALEQFFKENPAFAVADSHHRRLADYFYDTKFRHDVEGGRLTFDNAIHAARDEALKLMPLPTVSHPEGPPPSTRDSAIAEIAGFRGQEAPLPSGRSETTSAQISEICARNAGLTLKGDADHA